MKLFICEDLKFEFFYLIKWAMLTVVRHNGPVTREKLKCLKHDVTRTIDKELRQNWNTKNLKLLINMRYAT